MIFFLFAEVENRLLGQLRAKSMSREFGTRKGRLKLKLAVLTIAILSFALT